METSTFIDYYEILEISPGASSQTIDRIFRYFAQRYHPDNQDTGDLLRFSEVTQAHNTLKDPVKRALYDIQHKNHSEKLAEEVSDSIGIGVGRDVDIQNKLMSLLYVKRRQNINEAGIGYHDLERLTGGPSEHLEFHLWYMKEKGWIAKLDNGMFAITVEGVDHANSEHHRETSIKLLTQR